MVRVQGLLHIFQTLLAAECIQQLAVLRQALLFFDHGGFMAGLGVGVEIVCAESYCRNGYVSGWSGLE